MDYVFFMDDIEHEIQQKHLQHKETRLGEGWTHIRRPVEKILPPMQAKNSSDVSIYLGSTLFKNTNGEFFFQTIKGYKELLFKIEKIGLDILPTFDINDNNGKLMAKYQRKSFYYIKKGIDGQKKFEIKRSPNLFNLHDKDRNIDLFTVVMDKKGHLVVKGIFYFGSNKIEISEDKLSINGTSIIHAQNNTVDCLYQEILITHAGIKIGSKVF